MTLVPPLLSSMAFAVRESKGFCAGYFFVRYDTEKLVSNYGGQRAAGVVIFSTHAAWKGRLFLGLHSKYQACTCLVNILPHRGGRFCGPTQFGPHSSTSFECCRLCCVPGACPCGDTERVLCCTTNKSVDERGMRGWLIRRDSDGSLSRPQESLSVGRECSGGGGVNDCPKSRHARSSSTSLLARTQVAYYGASCINGGDVLC